MAIKFCMNFKKYYTKPKNYCTHLTKGGIVHLFKFHTFESLICIHLGLILKPKNVVLLCKKLYFLSLQ